MKLKTKLANEFYAKSPCDDSEIVEAYLAGFETAIKKSLEILEEYSSLPNNSGSTVTEGRDIYKRIKELGEEEVE